MGGGIPLPPLPRPPLDVTGVDGVLFEARRGESAFAGAGEDGVRTLEPEDSSEEGGETSCADNALP